MSQEHFGVIDNWLRHIKDVYRLHKDELDAIDDLQLRGRRFVELNVLEQVLNVCKTSTIQKAWEDDQRPWVHGWVYELANGVITDLNVNISNHQDLASIYKFDF
jgi:carbonic anhydrase